MSIIVRLITAPAQRPMHSLFRSCTYLGGVKANNYASTADTTTINLYGQTYDQILKSALAGKKDNFQLVYPFEDWAWKKPADGFIDADASEFVGRVPKWGAIGDFKRTDATVLQAYRSALLQCVKTVQSAQNRVQEQQAEQQLVNARNTQSRHESEKRAAWVAQNSKVPPGMPPPDYKEWYKNNWEETDKADAELVKKADETILAVKAQNNPEWTDAVKATEKPADYQHLKAGWVGCNDGSGEPAVRPNWQVPYDQDWTDRISTGGGGSSLKIQLTGSKESKSVSQSWAGGDANYSEYSFFQLFDAKGGWKKFDLQEDAKSLEVTIDIAAITYKDVSPSSDWYNGGYLQSLAVKDEWNTPYVTSYKKEGDKAVFGRNGVLQLITTGIVAGYQPSFSIKMSENTFSKHKQEFEGATGIGIGPFQFGASFKHDTAIGEKQATNNAFSGKSTSTYPFIIGITVAVPGGQSAPVAPDPPKPKPKTK